uniref:Uncharacterized protein n=1 Tax=Ciona savignyi TaxID=51511 RepID=H2YWP6_CIOSA
SVVAIVVAISLFSVVVWVIVVTISLFSVVHRPFDHDLKTWLEQASLKKS